MRQSDIYLIYLVSEKVKQFGYKKTFNKIFYWIIISIISSIGRSSFKKN